jgi:hypothetical protein
VTFSVEQSWAMSEPEKVVALLKENQLWRLAHWDGCCCSNFSVRNVNIDISCGKGREQAVWVSSTSGDYDDETLLRPIMAEVIKQLTGHSGRGGVFAEHFSAWMNERRAPRHHSL